jgi:phage recombination protein Bet
MSNIARIPTSAATLYDAKQLDLIRRTVAKDCNNDEFDLFAHTARRLGLDPLRKQVYAFVYSKDRPDKRKMTIVTGIDGFRTIAERTGNYRPDDDEPTLEVDAAAKGPNNPAGLVKATVRVFKFSHGDWHKVTASAYWDEYAPLKDEWVEGEDGRRRPSGKQTLDTSGNWGKMPRLMLAKVAEAIALRKAWPDAFSSVYAQEEIDRTATLDMLPSEAAEAGAAEKRMEKIGGANSILIQWEANGPLVPVKLGELADRALDFIKRHVDEPSAIAVWNDRNRHGLREFWARSPGDALEVKKAVEHAIAAMRAEA